MNATKWLRRVAMLGGLSVSLSACGAVPVPRVLEPVFGAPVSYTAVNVCLVDLNAPRGLRVAEAQKDERKGTLYVRRSGTLRPVPTNRDGGYAAEEDWFRQSEVIRQYGLRYVKFGPHRVVPANALTRGADHRGIPVFIDRNDIERPSALYIPVAPGCVFQPYVDARHANR
jgi:hypothetical protein